MNNETGIKRKKDLQNKNRCTSPKNINDGMGEEAKSNVFGNGSKLQEENILYFVIFSCTE